MIKVWTKRELGGMQLIALAVPVCIHPLLYSQVKSERERSMDKIDLWHSNWNSHPAHHHPEIEKEEKI